SEDLAAVAGTDAGQVGSHLAPLVVEDVADRATGGEDFPAAGQVALLLGQRKEFLDDPFAVGGDGAARVGEALGPAGDRAVGILTQLRPMIGGQVGAAGRSLFDGSETGLSPVSPAEGARTGAPPG